MRIEVKNIRLDIVLDRRGRTNTLFVFPVVLFSCRILIERAPQYWPWLLSAVVAFEATRLSSFIRMALSRKRRADDFAYVRQTQPPEGESIPIIELKDKAGKP